MKKELSFAEQVLNAVWINTVIKKLKEGGSWIWPREKHTYVKKGKKLVAKSKKSYDALAKILPPGYAKNVVKMKKT